MSMPAKATVAADDRLSTMWSARNEASSTSVTVGSPRKAWWVCSQDHEWEATVASIAKGGGCPYCSGRRVLPHSSLSALYPDIMKTWHHEKNIGLVPQEVAPKSNKKVWWICDLGHEWEASPNSRTSGRGCAVCSGKKVLPGFNDLRTLNPTLGAQWHSDKNDVDVMTVALNSNNKYWWQCAAGHEWQASANSRVQGNGCPYCAGSVAVSGSNDLETLNPTLAAQWHPNRNEDLTAASVLPQSNQKVWWMCAQGHEWEASVNNRSKGSGCPVCAGRIASEQTSLATEYPELAAQWHPVHNVDILPQDVRPGSSRKAWWMCDAGHEWEAVISSRVRGNGCPVCAGKSVRNGYNDLSSQRPDIAANWHPEKNGDLSPAQVTVSSNKKVWWLCGEGHEWEAPTAARSNGNGCPVCIGQKIVPGINDLVTLNPELSSQWHPTKNDVMPETTSPGSNKKAWWMCDAGHEWEAVVSTRHRQGVGCPYCCGARAIAGDNDLATLMPALAAQWHPTNNGDVTPAQVRPGSEYKASWMCELGHEWKAFVYSRAAGHNCPVCTGYLVDVGVTDLTTKNPALALEWHPEKNSPLTPDQVTAFSNRSVWWKCSQGHEWKANVYSRNAGNGCPLCAMNGTSKMEHEVADWLKEAGIDVVSNSRSIAAPYEVDIYLPKFKFAIEFNGLYWHSESAGKDRHYHRNKTQHIESKGITLFQVWEDDWRDRKQIVQRMILHRIGLSQEKTVAARKCVIDEVSFADASSLLNNHHIQGTVAGSSYIGLRSKKDDELVAVMVLKKTMQGVYLERYATGCRVPGGFTKLLKYARELYPSDDIITFADASVSQGALYENHGFVADTMLAPDYTYLYKGQRVHKFNFRKQRFESDPKLKYNAALSETELAALNNISRIWDSGKTRYVLRPVTTKLTE